MPNTTQAAGDRIIRFPEVVKITGLSRPTIYRRIAAGTFPKQVKLSESAARSAAAGFSLVEVTAWVEAIKEPAAQQPEQGERKNG
ncbi:helix-turn-helix transcriptional regulator [Stutzerimonas nitrititolerans]|uniref:helix-turn-helix transcriptional regulator n=1 Tax=Stutzerimonas nitrititolerans TaxID=2482751 RepID=UPI00289ABD2C|nr:AlpA family phage regulatory protein [Stutzerimonas nitrititolerans]